MMEKSKEETIYWILEQFKHMGASEDQLKKEEISMWMDPFYLFKNLEFFDN